MIRLGLTGHPLGHSLSPRLHAAALRACGLEGEYRLYPIAPDDAAGLTALLARLRSGELLGLNVTIPHKQAVLPLLDDLAPAAQAIGAVNAIFMKDGRLTGENTDARGFLADLKGLLTTERTESTENSKSEKRVSVDSVFSVVKKAVVLGAGGSARAVVYALAQNGWDVTIAARRIEQAEAIAASLQNSFPASPISSVELKEPMLRPLSPSLSLIVNTTPLGMSPNTDLSPWPADLPFPKAAVYDLVYNPRETSLVRAARAAGLTARTGLGMLVEQAALAFEIWTGVTPPRNAMFAAVEG